MADSEGKGDGKVRLWAQHRGHETGVPGGCVWVYDLGLNGAGKCKGPLFHVLVVTGNDSQTVLSPNKSRID